MTGHCEPPRVERTPREALGTAGQDYLKNVYKLARGGQRVTASLVAEKLGVSAPAVSKMLKRLRELHLVAQTPERELVLTPAGEKVALEVIRHHRLLELYLTQALGYSWDQVDEEAEKLEHHISEEFEDRIDELLGYPTRDPHGHPIPTKDGRIDETQHDPLSAMQAGQIGVVRRVADDDPAMLRYMGSLGLYPDARVQMLAREPFGGPLRVRIAGAEQAVGRELADHVFVAVDEP
jgi:DtxR family Mn-dependent transcriptional regulator